MPKYSGINRHYEAGMGDKEEKSLEEKKAEREKLMKEFLDKGGKIEKCPPGVAKGGVGSMDRSNKPRYTEAELKEEWESKNDSEQ